MSRWWVRLSAYAKPEWLSLSVLIVIALLRVGLDVLRPWPMKLIIDSVLKTAPLPRLAAALIPGTPNRNEVLLALTLATVLLFLAGWLLRVSETYVHTGTASRMRYALASDLFDHLQQLSLRFHGSRPTGDLVKRITADTGCIPELILDVALPLLTSVATLAAMFAIMWRLDPILSLVAIAAAPLQAFAIVRYARPMSEASYAQAECQGDAMALAEQTLSALPVVRAFGREEHEDHRFRELCRRGDCAYLHSIWTQLQFKLGVDSVTAIGTAAVLTIGGMHALQGRISIGTLLVFFSYLTSLYAPLETLAYLSASLASASAGARRVFDVLDSSDRLVEVPGAHALSHVRGHVRFEQVSAGYEPGRPVLKDITLDLNPGELVAIVGPTGAGKTTLVSLIPRFLDCFEGQVLLDGTPVSEIHLRSLRSQVAVVLQDAFLLPLTIAENISYGRPNASRTEVIAAAVAARADEFIRQLADGYDTVIGERGATLSGGERQRIAIARAFLKDAPVLILDEPTAALDAETELALIAALERLIEHRTTFVIAHRLSTVRKAHKLFVLDGGRIVETGTHDGLLRAGGLYAEFHAAQFGVRDEVMV